MRGPNRPQSSTSGSAWAHACRSFALLFLRAMPIAMMALCTARADDAQHPAAAASRPAAAQTPAAASPGAGSKSTAAEARTASQATHKHSPYAPSRFAGRAATFYSTVWGIDTMSVKLIESGELVRFSYRVVDPAKAEPLHAKQNEASLDDPKAGVSLVVPTMEQVGQLRQTPAPAAGRSYWMTFSNKGRRVARGDRVDVVIGPFRASNLVVD